jgi:hypothetical protein
MATTVLFIAGMGRSGSTLLERVLAGLPGVVCLGETVHGWERGIRENELCGCGAPFAACPFWSDVGRRGFGGWAEIDLDRVARLRSQVDRVRHAPRLALSSPDSHFDRLRAEYAGYYARLYAAAAQVSGADVVVDSSKQASLAHVLCRDPEVELRVLHCVRDARAVCHAWTKTVQRPEARQAGALMARYSPRDMAVQWSLHNSTVEMLRARKVAILRLRYEDFIDQPRQSVQTIAQYAGIRVGPGDLSFLRDDSVDLEPAHTVAGNPMRFTVGECKLRRDDAWRLQMPTRSRRAVTAMTLPMLLRYRYAVSV